jgi:hypothetical protein
VVICGSIYLPASNLHQDFFHIQAFFAEPFYEGSGTHQLGQYTHNTFLLARVVESRCRVCFSSVRICGDTKIVQPILAKSLRIHLSSDLECRSSQLAGSSRTSTRSLCNYDLERGKRCFIPRESPLAHFPLFPGKACLFQQLVDPNCPAYRRAPVYCVENLAKFPDIQVFTYMRKIRYVTQDPVYFPRLSCQIVPS